MTIADMPSADIVFDTLFAYQRSAALKSAIELDLFTQIDTAEKTSSQIASLTGASERGIRILCDYLCTIGLLVKSGMSYRLTPDTAAFLSQRSPAYLGTTVAPFVIDADPRNELVVVELEGEVVGVLQLTFIQYLLNQGAMRALVEGVRIIKSDSTNHQLISRVDWNLTHKDVISGRYIFDDTKFPLATGRFTAGAVFDVPSRNNNLGITYTRTLSSRWVNEARFNFSRLQVDFGDPTGTLPAPGIQFAGFRDLEFNLSSLT